MYSFFAQLFILSFFSHYILSIDVPESKDTYHNLNFNSSSSPCDTAALPIVFIHGFLASGDSYEKQALRFIANGMCPERLFMFNWNTTAMRNNSEKLDTFINVVLGITDSERVFLVGHSAGGGLGYSYLSDPSRARKVGSYVHIGARADLRPPGSEGEVPTLNIYSDGDPIVPGADIPGAQNLRMTKEDHYQVATSASTFVAMYDFFFGRKPITTHLQPSAQSTIQIAGKALTLGENQPMDEAEIEVYPLDPATGFRLYPEPIERLTVDKSGKWGPVEIERGATLELRISSEGRPVSYFRTPFEFDNPFVYLRGLPQPSSMAGMMLSGLPRDDNQSVVAIFTADQAAVHGRDHLRVNDIKLTRPEFASAGNSSIAWFLYDANNNQTTDTTAIRTFAMAPFLAGVDFFFDASGPFSGKADFNGRTIYFPHLKSDSDGIIVVIFD